MEFSVLASGSKANATLVRTETTSLLIDCGLSLREVTLRLRSLGVEPESISAILITHEHTDHVAGIERFQRNYQTPIYVNRGTAKAISETISVEHFSYDSFQIGDLEIRAIPVSHDAREPVGFLIEYSGKSLGVFTDLGQSSPELLQCLSTVDALILESNHDLNMLAQSRYPHYLQERIRGSEGHLSNCAAGLMLEQIASKESRRLKYVVAAHISDVANEPELALQGLREGWRRAGVDRSPEFIAASQKFATSFFSVLEDFELTSIENVMGAV